VARSQTAQTLEDVIALKKKYGQPILVEIEVERLLETSGKAHAVTENPRASMIGAPIAKFGAKIKEVERDIVAGSFSSDPLIPVEPPHD